MQILYSTEIRSYTYSRGKYNVCMMIIFNNNIEIDSKILAVS